MIKFEHTEVVGWVPAIRGMRNPMNSWDQSDSYYDLWEDPSPINPNDEIRLVVGEKDLALMKKLRDAGTDHRKFMRMIVVYVDITAPLYWWKEFDTYKVGTVVNSCSTMHKIHAKEFTMDDFSGEHLGDDWADEDSLVDYDREYDNTPKDVLSWVVYALNIYRNLFLKTKDKKWWWQMIQLLPTSYNQKRTVMLNYEVLANIYKARKNHKLDEWHDMCSWIENLPYSELITG